MGDVPRVLESVDNVRGDFGNAHARLYLRKDKRPRAAHSFRVAVHHAEICAHGDGEVGFIYHEKIGLGDAWPSLARNLVAAGNVDHLDGVVREFTTEAGGQVIAA